MGREADRGGAGDSDPGAGPYAALRVGGRASCRFTRLAVGVDVVGRVVIDLCGKICPYPVVEIVREAGRLGSGETLRCLVDDPLALKSVPEELEEFPDLTLTITDLGRVWEITVARD